MIRHWRIILVLLVLVLLSGVGGGFVGFRLARDQARRRSNPEMWNVAAMRTLERRLNLTPPQKERIQAVMDSHMDELREIRRETVAKTDATLDVMVAEIKREITPEQDAELQKLLAERKPASIEMLYIEPRKKP